MFMNIRRYRIGPNQRDRRAPPNTLNLCETFGAALKLSLPACEAMIQQPPVFEAPHAVRCGRAEGPTARSDEKSRTANAQPGGRSSLTVTNALEHLDPVLIHVGSNPTAGRTVSNRGSSQTESPTAGKLAANYLRQDLVDPRGFEPLTS